MAPFNPQPRRRPLLLNPGHGHRTPAPSIWNGPNKIVYCFLGAIFFVKVLGVLYTMVFTCDERGGFWCQDTALEVRYLDAAPKIEVRAVGGRDVPVHCEGPSGGCGAVVVDGVCVARSCAEGDGGVELGAQITRPPSEEVAGTPTVDEAGSWWWDRKSVPGGGAAECTGLCGSDADVKSGIKLQQYIGGFGLGLGLQPGPHTPTPKPSTKQNAPASTTTEQPDSTQTGDIPLQTNIESGEPRGVVQGVMWNSCASSALLLGLVAIGVVVLL